MVLVKAVLVVLSQSPAQETPVKKGTDVVVSASRMEEPAADVASSVTVVPGSRLERAQQRLLVEALREVPSVDVAQSGARGGLTAVFIRGADSGKTLVLVDGVEANDPVGLDRAFDFAHLTTDNVERIEVLRGPQSVLYGSDAMGGVINVVTRRGQGDPKVRLSAEAGSYATYWGALTLAGGNETVNYSLGASRLQTSGFSTADEDLEGNSEKDGYRNQTMSARVGVTPSKIFGLDVTVRGVEARSELDNFGGAFGDDPNHVMDYSQWMFRAAPRLVLLDGAWEQTFAASVSTIDFHDNNPVDTDSFGDFTFSSFESQLVDLDWQHTFALHETQILIVGAEFEEESAQSFTEGFFFSSVLRKQEAWTRGAYAQHRMHLWERMTVTGGVRVDSHEEFGTHGTWRATGAYVLPATATKVRGTVGTGFKAPSLFQLYSSLGDPDLEAEESLGWDAGFDQDLAGGRATFSATYFRNEFEELIDFDGGLGRYVNRGRAETWGVELAARVEILEGLEAEVSYTYLEAEDKETGEDLVRRARHKGGARLSYAAAETVRVTGSAVWVGNRPDFDFSTSPATVVMLDDYVLVGLAASWRAGGGVEIFARGENLLDQDYEEVLNFGVPEASVYAGASVAF